MNEINTLLFADDEVIIADSEYNLQRGVFTSQNIATIFGMEISPEKSEMVAFLGQDPVRCKIVMDNKCLQVKNLQYPCYEISYENEKGIQQKLAKFAQILGILNSTFKLTLVQTFSRIKVYNELALAILLHGSEIWTLGKKDKNIWHQLR